MITGSTSATGTGVDINIYGGYTSSNITDPTTGQYLSGDAVNNHINISNSTLQAKFYGGFTFRKNLAEANTVTISGSSIENRGIYGGYSLDGTASANIVTIENDSKLYGLGAYANIYGGYSSYGRANENTVIIDGSSIINNAPNCYIYGGYCMTSTTIDTIYNTVEIKNGAKIQVTKVAGGSSTANQTGNKLIISGSDNEIEGKIEHFETICFDAPSKDQEMLKLSTSTAYDIDANYIDVTNPNLAPGESATLINYQKDLFNGATTSLTFKVDGKEAVKSDPTNIINNTTVFGVIEDSDKKRVNFTEYLYGRSGNDTTGYKLTISNNGNYLSGFYTYKDSTGLKELGDTDNKTITIDSLPENVSVIYGAYSEDADTTAGGATVNLTTSLDLSNISINGSENVADNTKVSDNILNVSATGIKVANISNFKNLNFTLASENEAMLNVNSIAVAGKDLKTILPKGGFNGEKVLILSAGTLVTTDTNYYIGDKNIGKDISKSFDIATANDGSVCIGTYKYVLEDNSKLSIVGESMLTGAYTNDQETIGDKTLKLTNALAANRNEVYGIFNANNGDATGATVDLSEAVDNDNLTIYGGFSNSADAKVKDGNTLNVAKVGNNINTINNFENINFKADSYEGVMLGVRTLDLSGMNVKTELPDSGFAGIMTLVSSVDSIGTTNTKYWINGEELADVDSVFTNTNITNDGNVNVGTYQYGFSSNKSELNLTGSSIITGAYIKDHSATTHNNTLTVSQELAGLYRNVYGVYNADGDAANGATVKLSETIDKSNLTIYGGYSTGDANVKDNNTLDIDKKGNNVKAICNFANLNFTLNNDVTAGDTMLKTTDKADLTNTTVNAEMSDEIVLGKGEKIVLLDNAEKSSAKLYLNGSESDKRNVDEGDAFVTVNVYGYTDDEDEVAIGCKDAFAAGNYIDTDGTKYGNGKITLGYSEKGNVRAGCARAVVEDPLTGMEHIYGIYSASAAEDAKNATVDIISDIEYVNSTLHGGYNAASGNFCATGNTLNVNTRNAKVKGITHFENMNFNLPAETQNGDTMLKVTDAVDLEPTKKIGVDAQNAQDLHAGDSVKLIDSDGGIQHFGSQEINIGIFADKEGEIVVNDKALVLNLKQDGEKPNQNTKAPVEGIAAALALVNQAGDLAANKLDKSMMFVDDDSDAFAAISGAHNKYETGSYVKADSWNIGFGTAKKGLSKKNPDTTYGWFLQYGESDFDTHNDNGFRGDGESKLFGAGLMFHQEARSKYYYHGNVYAGKIDAKWHHGADGYDDKASYYGMTFGMGHKHNAGENKVMDVYGRYSFNHVGSMEGFVGGYNYHFDSANSNNLRFGLRMEYAKKNAGTAYWGLAWEHEFSGDCGATMNLGRTDAPSLHGDSGIAEVGYTWKRGDWNYNFNVEGSFGKREGVTGAFNIIYNF